VDVLRLGPAITDLNIIVDELKYLDQICLHQYSGIN